MYDCVFVCVCVLACKYRHAYVFFSGTCVLRPQSFMTTLRPKCLAFIQHFLSKRICIVKSSAINEQNHWNINISVNDGLLGRFSDSVTEWLVNVKMKNSQDQVKNVNFVNNFSAQSWNHRIDYVKQLSFSDKLKLQFIVSDFISGSFRCGRFLQRKWTTYEYCVTQERYPEPDLHHMDQLTISTPLDNYLMAYWSTHY